MAKLGLLEKQSLKQNSKYSFAVFKIVLIISVETYTENRLVNNWNGT